MTYPVTSVYAAGAERGLRWNDPAFAIEWPIQPVILSPKDQQWSDWS